MLKWLRWRSTTSRFVPSPPNADGPLEQLSLRPDPDRRLEHQTRLLGERHLREEVIDPLLERTPGILVGIQPAVAVEVAHAPAVDLDPTVGSTAIGRRSYGGGSGA